MDSQAAGWEKMLEVKQSGKVFLARDTGIASPATGLRFCVLSISEQKYLLLQLPQFTTHGDLLPSVCLVWTLAWEDFVEHLPQPEHIQT